MAATKSKKKPPPAKRGTRGQVLTDKQKMFVAEYLVSLNLTDAARKAGYDVEKAPGHIRQLTDPKKYPLIAYQIEQAIAKREQILEYKADDLMRQIQTVAFLDCTFWFEPGDGEYWYIKEADYKNLPMPIRQCIKAAKFLTEYKPNEDGVLVSHPTGVVGVQIMDKEHMMALCAKFMLTEKKQLSGTIHQVNWDMLIEVSPGKNQAIASESKAIEDKKKDDSAITDQAIVCPSVVPQDHVEKMIEEARRVQGDSSIQKHINTLQSTPPQFPDDSSPE